MFAKSFRGIALNALRMATEGPLVLVRSLLSRLGLEQKLKKAWRARATPSRAAINK